MKKRRPNNTFSLSFLDIMCCGFGAVVLLVMLLNGETLQKREEAQKNLQAELERAVQLKEFAGEHLKEIQAQVEDSELQEGDLWVQAESIRRIISTKKEKREAAQEQIKREEDDIQALQKEIASLERLKKRHQAKEDRISTASKKIGFDGTGKRQYLTGLKLGGSRTLILVDASASMLDETIVNIVRRKLMNDDLRRRSPKWLRAVRSLHWLVANLSPDKKFQVFYFNTEAHPAVRGTENRWLNTGDPKHLNESIAAVRRLAPQGGTNLRSAFEVIGRLEPKPDSVVLLTDGLPTQGKQRKVPDTVTGAQRLALFRKAVKSIPTGVPVNTLLFPIEGDPQAAVSFWGLAINTQGSFITPSRDWPIMREKHRPIEVFSLSFLDVISCGFGAIILLLVLSLALEPATLERMSIDLNQEIARNNDERANIMKETQQLQAQLNDKQATLERVKEELAQLLEELGEAQKRGPSREVDVQARVKDELKVVLQALTKEMKNLLSQERRKIPKDDATIGGIPVDSEYIIFVIDTSGSMLSAAWPTVIKKIEEVLSVYPDVKGIQVMNDMGTYMFGQYAGLWIPDTPSRRKEIVRQLRNWKSFSNSSPVEGVTEAVRAYFQKGHRVSLYVFGDDFSSGSIDAVLKEVAATNKKDAQGRSLVRIHTFGFPVLFRNQGAAPNRARFAHLMRLLAEQNSGSFVGLTDPM